MSKRKCGYCYKVGHTDEYCNKKKDAKNSSFKKPNHAYSNNSSSNNKANGNTNNRKDS